MPDKLDLHGVYHEDVEVVVEDYILHHDPPFNIVTGNSIQMKNLTIKILEKYELEYFYKHPNNLGCMTIIQKRK